MHLHIHLALFDDSVSGIPGELYYVKDGVINDYALTFNLPLKPDVDEIYFNWQNLRRIIPVNDDLRYTGSEAARFNPHVLLGRLGSTQFVF